MKYFTTLFTLFLTYSLAAQEDIKQQVNIPYSNTYEFTTVIDIEASAVKSQGKTGTCWSFSTSSFIESEIYRNTGKLIDISEMYTVRNTYPKKAWNYVMRQGKLQFSEGGLAHDVMNAINSKGLVPESAYSGLIGDSEKHDHSKLVTDLKLVLDIHLKNDKKSPLNEWRNAVDSILDSRLGKTPETFVYDGITFNANSFLAYTNLNPKNYITLTSFQHKPLYNNFVLNIPDNFSNGQFYNLPLDKLVAEVDHALKNGYTIALDCDVSEKTFSGKFGIAVIPEDPEDNKKSLNYLVKESEIDASFRQAEFENFNTTDDHLMHIIGVVVDQYGNEYYKVKNSWGTNSERIGNDGYVFMSKNYFKLKTISVMVHKEAISDKTLKLLKV